MKTEEIKLSQITENAGNPRTITEEVQKFMEDSALVIVDIDKAIEDGFVKISKDFMEQYGKEHGNDAE